MALWMQNLRSIVTKQKYPVNTLVRYNNTESISNAIEYFGNYEPELRPRRTGVLAVKIGMMPVWDKWGIRHPCTVLQVENCHVAQVKTEETHGYTNLQLGVGERKAKRLSRTVLGHLEKAGLSAVRELQEFKVSPDQVLPLGHKLCAQHFLPGQYVDVCGTSIGKGFQGVMKRHNFSGQPASHGNSKSHRKAGSTGQCQDPGRTFKGKKMAGRMGGKRVTTQNLVVMKIDTERDLIYVRGAVPGNKGGVIRVTDSIKKKLAEDIPLPTFIPVEGEEYPKELLAQSQEDPLFFEIK